jgi:hypothetical protein
MPQGKAAWQELQHGILALDFAGPKEGLTWFRLVLFLSCCLGSAA